MRVLGVAREDVNFQVAKGVADHPRYAAACHLHHGGSLFNQPDSALDPDLHLFGPALHLDLLWNGEATVRR